MTKAQKKHYIDLREAEKAWNLVRRLTRGESINTDQFDVIYNFIKDHGDPTTIPDRRYPGQNITLHIVMYCGIYIYSDGGDLNIVFKVPAQQVTCTVRKYHGENRLLWL